MSKPEKKYELPPTKEWEGRGDITEIISAIRSLWTLGSEPAFAEGLPTALK
jgi:hypothetical protein